MEEEGGGRGHRASTPGNPEAEDSSQPAGRAIALSVQNTTRI